MIGVVDFHELKETQTLKFREVYADVEQNAIGALIGKYAYRVEDVLNSDFSHSNLTDYQCHVVANLFEQFNVILNIIEPQKLSFTIDTTEDGELVLHKRSAQGVTGSSVNVVEQLGLSI